MLNCEHGDCKFVQINGGEIKSNAIYFDNVNATWTIASRNNAEVGGALYRKQCRTSQTEITTITNISSKNLILIV